VLNRSTGVCLVQAVIAELAADGFKPASYENRYKFKREFIVKFLKILNGGVSQSKTVAQNFYSVFISRPPINAYANGSME
jgi:hypothetical protein